MTLEEAIEIIERDLADTIMPHKQGVRKAEKLLIEAGKRVQDMRISPCTTADEILPGETRD